MMKRGISWVILVIVIIILILNIKLSLEKPKVNYENSLDLNTDGIDPSNQEFIIEKSNKIGILLVHGLGASPYQTKELAGFLSEKNITVYSVRVSGHGTNLSDMEKSKWSDWYSSVESAYNILKSKTEKTCVLGISSGAALSLYLAENNNIDCLIVIAPPVYLKNPNARFAPLMVYFKRYHYFGIDKTQIGHAYENLPTKSVSEFIKLIKVSSSNINNIDEPILIIQSSKDTVVDPKSAQYVFDNVQSKQKEIIWANSISHAVIRAYESDTEESQIERQKVFNDILTFITK